MSEWVSVENRLPAVNEPVLCSTPSRIFVGHFDMETEHGNVWMQQHSAWATRHVTHWQPLPDPPETNGDN